MKRLFFVLCCFAVNIPLMYAGGKADDVIRIAARKLPKEILEFGAKKADDAIRYASRHADDWARAGSTRIDSASRVLARNADNIARLGIKQGDNVISDFTRIHSRNIARTLGTKTDNAAKILAIHADDAARIGLQQGKNTAYKYIPKTKGTWNGAIGDSTFFPDLDHIPRPGKQLNEMYSTPKTWKEIGEQNFTQVRNISEIPSERRLILSDNYKKFSSGEIGIDYKQGEINLSPFSYDTIDVRSVGHEKIPGWRYIRDDPLKQGRLGLMDVGDAALAKKMNKPVDEVRAFMQKHGLTYHERSDMLTLDVVPVDIHLITHRGGHAAVNAVN